MCGEEIESGWKVKSDYICCDSFCVDMWFDQIAKYWEEDDNYCDDGEDYE